MSSSRGPTRRWTLCPPDRCRLIPASYLAAGHESLADAMTDTYDMALIDPPVLPVTDAAVLAGRSMGAYYRWHGSDPPAELREALYPLETAGCSGYSVWSSTRSPAARLGLMCMSAATTPRGDVTLESPQASTTGAAPPRQTARPSAAGDVKLGFYSWRTWSPDQSHTC